MGAHIMVDQFGYLPTAEKVAVIRDPIDGFDSSDSYTPGATLNVVNTADNSVAFSGAIQAWNSGATDDAGSGDRAWWFDFSEVTTTGEFYLHDPSTGDKSFSFRIGTDVYREVLIQALRVLFYQRAGYAKAAPFAEEGWEDGASHLGALQDSQARLYSSPGDAGTERDLQGGWYDAGDYNKYTNWTADYIIGLIYAYREKPAVWSENFNLPESNNGIPDIIDEMLWGADYLRRLQNEDGSVLSIVGLSHASPPSAATGPSEYGSASTSATLSSAAAFALTAVVLTELNDESLTDEIADFTSRAVDAWQWAVDNPSVIFLNNDADSGTQGLGAGQQEVLDELGQLIKKLEAAAYLFELTGSAEYAQFFDANYDETQLVANTYAGEFEGNIVRMLLHYASLAGVASAVADDIKSKFISASNGGNLWGAINNQSDPYRAYLGVYTWGSSAVKSMAGSLFYEAVLHDLGSHSDQQNIDAAAGYLHYMHGVNPLGKVYLSNMSRFGAENSVDQFYHTWFANGSALWDSVSESTYGPPPGFVVGGPNPYYNWDGCCPNNCGNANAICGSAPPSPPFDQPPQKSYTDFNTSWPLNSWEITENSNGYQINYLRLLSKFVSATE